MAETGLTLKLSESVIKYCASNPMPRINDYLHSLYYTLFRRVSN